MTADVICIASWNADLVSRVAQPLARGETVLASHFDILPGGKGSNAAVAAARQGAAVAVVARIGDDDFGRMALTLWQREGVATAGVAVATGERSGVAQILVYADGDNSIAVALGAGAGLGPAQVQVAAAAISQAKVVMAPNEVPLAATLAAFGLARQHGVCTLLNPAPAQALPDELLALCDVVTPNEGELFALAGLGGGGNGAPLQGAVALDAAAAAVLARGVAAVLVTCGANGCRLYQPGLAPLLIAGWKVTVADTVGAGDTCTGALAAALARGLPLPLAARWANAAAALSVTGHGAISAMPSRAEVERLLASSMPT